MHVRSRSSSISADLTHSSTHVHVDAEEAMAMVNISDPKSVKPADILTANGLAPGSANLSTSAPVMMDEVMSEIPVGTYCRELLFPI